MPLSLSRVNRRHALGFLAAVFLSPALAGCTSFGTPPASMLKLARLQPLEADPGAIRFALATPSFLRLRDGDITVTVKFDTGDPATSFVEEYKPVVEDGAAETPGIVRDRLDGRTLAITRFDERDREGFRAMQNRIKAFRAAGGEGRGSLSIGATGCRHAQVPDGPARFSAWLQAEPGEAYFALVRDIDLRTQLKAAGVDLSYLPRCEDASASGQFPDMRHERGGRAVALVRAFAGLDNG